MSSLEAPRRSWHPATMITRYPDFDEWRATL
jgi:hypothetical protein